MSTFRKKVMARLGNGAQVDVYTMEQGAPADDLYIPNYPDLQITESGKYYLEADTKKELLVPKVVVARGTARLGFEPEYDASNLDTFQRSLSVQNYPVADPPHPPKGGGRYTVVMGSGDQSEVVEQRTEETDEVVGQRVSGRMNTGDDIDVYSGLKGQMTALRASPEAQEGQGGRRYPRTIHFVSDPRPNPKPTAKFKVADKNQLAVTLDASGSSDPDTSGELTYRWTIEGREIVREEPTLDHTFGCGGIYSVGLTVVDPDGAEDSTEKALIVGDSVDPEVSIVAPETGTAGRAVEFRARVSDQGDIESMRWEFPDGASADGRTARYTFENPGSYPVHLRVEDCTGNATRKTHRIEIEPREADPTAVMSGPRNVVAGERVEFSAAGSSDPDGTIESYEWTFGTDSASGRTVTHTFEPTNPPTTTVVELTVTDDDGRTDVVTRRVEVLEGNEGPEARIDAPDTVYNGTQVRFDGSRSSDPDGSIESYEWRFPDGTTASGEQARHTFFTHDPPKTFTVSLSVTDDDGRADSVGKTVTVRSGSRKPEANVEAPPVATTGDPVTVTAAASTDPDGTIESYEWTFGDGTTAAGERASHTYRVDDPPETFTVTLTVTDDQGLSATDSARIRVTGENEGPNAVIDAPAVARVGERIAVDGSQSTDPDGSIDEYEWALDGRTATGPHLSHSYDEPGSHQLRLTVTDDDGETDTTTATVHVTGGGRPGPIRREPEPEPVRPLGGSRFERF